MKKNILIALSLLTLSAYAGQRAVTDNGSIVLLNDNGTWTYESNEAEKPRVIELNKKTFSKSANQTFLLKSTKNKSAVWLDPKKWSFRKSDENSGPAEYKFQLKGVDLYGMIISEQIEFEQENLAQFALENTRKIAPNAKIVSQEYRVVNGIKLIRMRIDASAQGVNFSYIGHYMSDKSGSTQFVTYTATNLIDRNMPEIEEFLNGLSLQQ